MTKKCISQEAFDEMVKENMEMFDQEAEEALKSTVEELEMQGVDLSGIIKSLPGANIEEHPIAQSTATLRSLLSSDDLDSSEAEGALKNMSDAIKASSGDAAKVQEVQAVATKFKSIEVVIKVAKHVVANAGLFAQAVDVLCLLLVSKHTRDAFFDENGADVMGTILEWGGGKNETVELIARVAVQSCYQHEGNKCKFMDCGVAARLVEGLRSDISDSCMKVSCKALVAFTTGDDPAPPTSRAFQNARTLAQLDLHKTLLEILGNWHANVNPGELPGVASDVLIDVLYAFTCVCANDEICKEVSGDGGVGLCLNVWKIWEGVPEVVVAVVHALKQLAQSDVVKREIIEAGGADTITKGLTVHALNVAVVQAVIGLLTNMTLRHPAVSRSLCAAGCAGQIAEAMRNHDNSPQISRQACMCVRNIAVRAEDCRVAFLETGVEALIGEARKRHPRSCSDVGSAALRDLGLDDYK